MFYCTFKLQAVARLRSIRRRALHAVYKERLDYHTYSCIQPSSNTLLDHRSIKAFSPTASSSSSWRVQGILKQNGGIDPCCMVWVCPGVYEVEYQVSYYPNCNWLLSVQKSRSSSLGSSTCILKVHSQTSWSELSVGACTWLDRQVSQVLYLQSQLPLHHSSLVKSQMESYCLYLILLLF